MHNGTSVMSELRWQKFAPVDRDTAIFELLLGNTIVLDLSRDDGGKVVVTFHGHDRAGACPYESLLERLAEGVRLLECE